MTAIGVIVEGLRALDDSKGAKADIRYLRHDLSTFQKIVVAIRNSDLEDTSLAQHDALEQAIDECYNIIHSFFDDKKMRGL